MAELLLLTEASLGAYVAPMRPMHGVSFARRRHRSTDIRSALEPVEFKPLVALQAAWSSDSFGEFMAHLRSEQGDAVFFDLWPVAPKTYLLMGKEANRHVLSSLDPSLEQILQELINVLPVSAKVPSAVDVPLQRKVASLFQSESVVNERLPSFGASAREIQQRWGSLPAGSELEVFTDLSEYVLLANLEVICACDHSPSSHPRPHLCFDPSLFAACADGRAFREAHSEAIQAEFAQWVENIAAGKSPISFFKKLGELLRGSIADMRVRPDEYSCERSVLSVYLESGALGRHDEDALVGLLSMTLMAAVFNTQVSLSWILVHLYSDPALLQRARDEIASCADLRSYAEVERLPFLNSCIDEAVRLHTMLPGNTVLRKAKRAVQLGSHTVPAGAVLWLYPNAVHLDEVVFPEPKAFCPMRLLHGELERMQDEFEIVTFGHGRKRCIGEKMARAQIVAFLGHALPTLDADAPETLPQDGFFDLVPASELRLYNLRPAGSTTSAPMRRPPSSGAQPSQTQQRSPTQSSWADAAADTAAGIARDLGDMVQINVDWTTHVARSVQKKVRPVLSLEARKALWGLWLWLWQSWVNSTDFRHSVADRVDSLRQDGVKGTSAASNYASGAVRARLEQIFAMSDPVADADGERDATDSAAAGGDSEE